MVLRFFARIEFFIHLPTILGAFITQALRIDESAVMWLTFAYSKVM
jgi:hypothetical protein